MKHTQLMLSILLSFALVSCATTAGGQLERGKRDYADHHYTRSFNRLKHAAIAGDPDAEYAIGYMYYNGQGTDQDVETGLHWIHKAAAHGQPQAMKAAHLLEQDEHPEAGRATMEARRRVPSPAAKANSKHHYTLQLMGSYQKQSVRAFMKQHDLVNNVHIHKTIRSGQNWYVLHYGNYRSAGLAHAALKKLPSDLQHRGAWVKHLAS